MPKRKKPTGRSGFYRVTGAGEGASVDNPQPDEKAEIEGNVVDMFLRSHTYFTGEPFFLSNPRQNKENDFDFTVTSPRGDADLELMEVAPLSDFGGSYEGAPAIHTAGDLAAVISRGIFKKSKRYKPKRELFLLLYLTHWSLAPGQATIQLLRYRLNKQRHVFSAVFYFAPLDGEVGVVEWLFPVPPGMLLNFKPEDYEKALVMNFDYRNWQIKRGDGPTPESQPEG
jgi:hypothetical protein